MPREMSRDEAIRCIEVARHPGDLFGRDPSRTYRRLARLTHPDARPGDARAARAFTKLATLWQQHQGNQDPARLVARGDLANLTLLDWCYSVSDHTDRVPAIVERYRHWYPPEVLERRMPGPYTDIYLATRCMTRLMGARAPKPLITFARGCALPNPKRRPHDAWLPLGELDELLERLYGPRRFRAFAIPA